jgi:DNA uptake protein ComE-like DNA-binding protein
LHDSAPEPLASIAGRAAALLQAEPAPGARSVSTDTPKNSADRLNSASREELLAIYGIGPVLADRIIAGRPYRFADEVLERGILNQQAFAELRRGLLDVA